MASNLQIAANRDNARKSTGPKSEAGRAAVRLNALKHGLTATTLVLDGESRTKFEALIAAVHAEHLPSTPTEEALVTQIAMAIWRLRRFFHMEAGFLTMRYLHAQETLSNYTGLQPADYLGFAVGQNFAALTSLSLYEVRAQSCLIKALHQLHLLRARRPAKTEKQTQIHPVASKPQPQSAPKDNAPTQPAPAPEGGLIE